MITYEQALEIAKYRKPNAVKCTEYETAYLFESEEIEYSDGGSKDAPLVISKEDGSYLHFADFMMTYPKKIKVINLV